MNYNNCIFYGTVFKLHGYKGEVNIYSTIPVLDIKKIKNLFINVDGIFIPFFTENIRLKKKHIYLVKFKDVNSELEAKKILKREVFIAKDYVDSSSINNSKDSIIGYEINDIKHGKLGIISHINNQTGQNLIYVESKKNQFCFPMHEEFITFIDKKNKVLKTKIPLDIIHLN